MHRMNWPITLLTLICLLAGVVVGDALRAAAGSGATFAIAATAGR